MMELFFKLPLIEDHTRKVFIIKEVLEIKSKKLSIMKKLVGERFGKSITSF